MNRVAVCFILAALAAVASAGIHVREMNLLESATFPSILPLPHRLRTPPERLRFRVEFLFC